MGYRSGAASSFAGRGCGLLRAPASIGAGPGVVHHRLRTGGRAVRRHSGGPSRRAAVCVVRGDGQRCRAGLRGAPRPGAVRCRHGLRARRHHGGRARWDVDRRRAGHVGRGAARTVLVGDLEERTAARGAADGVDRRLDRGPADRHDRGRSIGASAAWRRRVAAGSGWRCEKQSGGGAVWGDCRGRRDHLGDQRLAGAIARSRAARRGFSHRAVGRSTGDRDDAQGERRSLLRELPGRRRRGGARAWRHADLGRPDRARRGATERDGRELDHARRRCHRRSRSRTAARSPRC